LKPASYQIDLLFTYDLNLLAGEWQVLESQARASFFLSWTWISTWLESVCEAPLLVRVRAGQDIVALGFLARTTVSRYLFVRSRQIHLHQTGDGDLDRIATEFNGFLVRQGCEEDAIPQILGQLRTLVWDECILPGVPARYRRFADAAGYPCVADRSSYNFIVDLDRLRRQKADVGDAMSRNSRAQLRRALRLARAEGALSIDPAADMEQALSYFAALKQLDRWARRGQSGAFATPAREQFHRRLIARGWGRGEVELLHVRAGLRTIGFLYQFSYCGRILAYQAGYIPENDNRRRFGIVMHYLAIERAKARGAQTYDFLAGHARYKKSLGSEDEQLVWIRLQRPKTAFVIERFLRRVRDAL
jgi:CelD/BcsL family acetyltransferase involved in cellulose biosynthesis